MKPKLALAIALLLISSWAFAEGRQIPLFFNYQATLIDEGGNLLPDGASNLTFRILDSAGTILYEESQDLEVVKGQVSAMVGNGINPSNGAPTGGLPSSAFDPVDQRYLQVEVSGQKPYDQLEIVTAPYALWADTALKLPAGAITSEMIGKGVITKEHLNKNEELFKAIFPEDGIPKTMLPSDTIYKDDFEGFRDTVQSSYGASKVGVTTAFIYSGSQTVQGVLSDLDLAVKKRQEEVEFAKRDYGSKVTAEEKARKEADSDIEAKNLSRDGSEPMTGTLQFDANADAFKEPQFKNQVTGKNWHVDSTGAATVSSLNASSGMIQTTGTLSAGATTVTGGMTISEGNITLKASATVDSVDVSAHDVATTGVHGVGTGSIVDTALIQTLSNKTLDVPVLASFYQDAGKAKLMTVPNTTSDTLVTLTATQTLSNKTYQGSLSDTTGNHSGTWQSNSPSAFATSGHNHDSTYVNEGDNHSGTWQSNSPSAFATSGHNHDSTYVNVSGDMMAGPLNMGGQRIDNVGSPNSGDDAMSRNASDERYVKRIYGIPIRAAAYITASGAVGEGYNISSCSLNTDTGFYTITITTAATSFWPSFAGTCYAGGTEDDGYYFTFSSINANSVAVACRNEWGNAVTDRPFTFILVSDPY